MTHDDFGKENQFHTFVVHVPQGQSPLFSNIQVLLTGCLFNRISVPGPFDSNKQ